MQQPSIVLVGHVCIDHNISEHTQYENWGSSVLYMARYWQQQHHVEPTILTTYGQDFKQFTKPFSLYPTEAIPIPTLIFENKTKDGQRTQRCFHANMAVPPTLDDDARMLLANADVVIVAPLLANYPAAFIRNILQYSAPNAIKIFVPQGYFRRVSPEGIIEHQLSPSVDKLIPLFDVTVYSQEDRNKPFEYATQVTKDTEAAIVVTQGPDGASVVRDGQLLQIPTIAVAEKDIVDSVGCGDTFTAGLAHSLLTGKSIAEAVADAHHVARAKLFRGPA